MSSTDNAGRKAALDQALASIDKQFGKGSAMRLGDKKLEPMEYIPTGSLALDIALGIGGIPRGRVVEIYGPESSGKCLTADALLPTNWGLLTVKEIFEKCDTRTVCTTRITDVSTMGLEIVNEYGQLEHVSHLTHNNRKPVYRVTTSTGKTVTVTGNHPIRVLTTDGDFEWRQAIDITVGDTVLGVKGGNEHAKDHITPEFAALLGHTMREARNNPNSGNATIPQDVRQSGHAVQHAFLTALLNESDEPFRTRSAQLARETQTMLLAMGNATAVTHDGNEWTVTPAAEQHLTIPHLHHKLVAFWEHTGRNPELADLIVADDRHTPSALHAIAQWADRAGESNHPTITHLKNVLQRDHTYETVTAFEYAGLEPTFDLVVPGTHSFVANGLAVHNTTATLHMIANAQKQGGTAAFVDAEHALDPEYAANLGVDIENLIISQPDTGEQALEIVDMLVRSGAIDLIVIDSVAALVPRAEIEGNMGDSHVGLQARLMSQALRKLTGGLKQTNTTAIFINQLREKIGVMFGCFHYSSPVSLADGSTLPIGEIVEKNLNVDVLSYNPDTGNVEPKKVIGWYDNGIGEVFHDLDVRINENVVTLTVTPNHLIATNDGWEAVEDLHTGDTVLVRDGMHLTEGEVVGNQISAISGVHKYDIEVEDTHNYFVDGAMVHNSPETTTGGKALKFYSSVRLDIRRIEALKDGTDIVGNRTRVKVVKNKVAPPFKQAEFDIIYGEGISYEGEVIDLGVQHGIVKKSGAWYNYDGTQLGQGKENTRKYLKEHPEVKDEIAGRVLEAAGLPAPAREETPSE